MNNEKILRPLSEEEKMLAAGYVLGDLTEGELEKVKELSEQNSEFLEEVRALTASFNLMPTALPKIAPSPSLESSILDAYSVQMQQEVPEKAKQQSLSRSWTKVVAIITSITTVLLGLSNLWLHRQLRLARQIDTDRVAAILQQPKSRLIALEGKEGSSAAGTLLFTPGRWQEVVVSLGNLPPLPPEEVYRMWLSLANGEAIFCGEFNTREDGSVFIRLTPPQNPPKGVKAKGIFVTVNDAASKLQPVGEKVLSGSI